VAAQLDREKALAEVQRFIEELAASRHLYETNRQNRTYWKLPEWMQQERTVNEMLPLIEKIGAALDDRLAKRVRSHDHYGWTHASQLTACEEMVGILRRVDHETAIFEPRGPRLDAKSLHPWVWDGAQSLWRSGHFREAVRAASVMVNAEAQSRLGTRDVSETALFQMAFSADPPTASKPRLRLPEDDGGKTATSVRRGMMAFAEGCYAAIRNPVSHDPLAELPEHEALEQLAAFSILARWVERAKVLP